MSFVKLFECPLTEVKVYRGVLFCDVAEVYLNRRMD